MINLDNSSDGESKDDSLFTGIPNQLLLLGEETISLDDSNVTNESNVIPSSSIVIPTDIPVPFEEYYTNSDNVRLIDRSRYLLAACFGTVEEYSLEVSPYKDLKKPMLPTQVMLRQEILRRSPGTKIRKMKNKDLLALLQSEELKVSNNVDKKYIADREKEYRMLLIAKEEEAEKEREDQRGPNITSTDRLRYLEVMLSDEVKVLYRSSQDCLTRSNLDARNSVMRVVDFYDKAVEVFNNPEFVPETVALPDLHDDFANVISLPLKDYRLTRDKAKDLMVSIRPRLASIVANYELSGAGAGQMREEGCDEYGHFDLDQCVDGDDRRMFIKNAAETYLLYWWHRLDCEGFVQFTLCVLDKFQRANSADFALVSNKNIVSSSPTRAKKDDELKEKMTNNIGKVGDGVQSLSYITIQREIENWETKHFDLTCKLIPEINEGAPSSAHVAKVIKKRIRELEDKIEEAKKRCVGL